ncbi:hypothetical protein [Denitratisoma sp. agr-D3]
MIELLQSQEASVQSEPERLFKQGERVRLTEAPFRASRAATNSRWRVSGHVALIEIMSKPVAVCVAQASLRNAGNKSASLLPVWQNSLSQRHYSMAQLYSSANLQQHPSRHFIAPLSLLKSPSRTCCW